MPKLTYRMAAPTDLPALTALINIANRVDDVPQVVELEELIEELHDAGEVTTDVRVAELDNELVGYVRTMYLPSDQLWERCYLIGTVHPDHRGHSIGRTLMTWAIDRGSALIALTEIPQVCSSNFPTCEAWSM